jgi:hypothetical protein
MRSCRIKNELLQLPTPRSQASHVLPSPSHEWLREGLQLWIYLLPNVRFVLDAPQQLRSYMRWLPKCYRYVPHQAHWAYTRYYRYLMTPLTEPSPSHFYRKKGRESSLSPSLSLTKPTHSYSYRKPLKMSLRYRKGLAARLMSLAGQLDFSDISTML